MIDANADDLTLRAKVAARISFRVTDCTLSSITLSFMSHLPHVSRDIGWFKGVEEQFSLPLSAFLVELQGPLSASFLEHSEVILAF